jgi:ubiquitin conjugation factor E4 B
MPDMPNWIPAPSNPPSGALIEQASLLGRFFSISPLSPGVPPMFFKDPKVMTQGDKVSMSRSIQESLRIYQDYLFKICSLIIKSGPHGRRGVLDWFSAALTQNEKRRAIQVDAALVASHGFMCNVVAVLNKFAEPFVGIKADKVISMPPFTYVRLTRSM